MRIVAATKNKGKIREISEILGGLGIEVVSLSDAGIDVEIIETGTTFIENARIKAEAVSLLCDDAVLADDSGLCVDALDGAPGVFSARYSGEGATDASNTAKLLQNLSGTVNREAHFETAVVLILPDGTELSAHGRVSGRITAQPVGESGFGYDPVFYCDELGKTFGEATDDEKNRVSHRSRALTELFELIRDKKIISDEREN